MSLADKSSGVQSDLANFLEFNFLARKLRRYIYTAKKGGRISTTIGKRIMADAKNSSPSEQQVRLIVWSVPRSTSTVLTKCLSFVDNSLVFFEPYINAFYSGPDGVMHTEGYGEYEAGLEEVNGKMATETVPVSLTRGFDPSQCSYKWVKEQLEGDHTGKRFIFCKDMAYAISENKREFIPNGYRHVFLIRHPLKVLSSWKKVFQFFVNASEDAFKLDELPPQMFPPGYSFGEVSSLFDYVKETHDRQAIIIDADDLLRDPKAILSTIFKAVDLPFEERFLSWEAGEAITQEWVASNIIMQGNQLGKYYKTAFESTYFTKPRALPDRSSVSADILRCVDVAMPYYDKMYAQRLTVA